MTQLHAIKQGKLVTRCYVWGHGHSWAVVKVSADGGIVWRSEWMRSRDRAQDLLEQILEGRPTYLQQALAEHFPQP